LTRVEEACEAILTLSGTTNGRLATEGFRSLERTCGVPLADLSGTREADRITFHDAQVQPRTVITSPEWSGIEAHGRRYSPFTMNVEREKPWHTLSGRMHFYVDHQWMLELGEGLPVFRPPLHYRAIFGDQGARDGSGRAELTLKYLTPHSKWSIHSEYQDNLHMLTLFRGGGMLWVSREDAEALGVRDNDWLEAFNRNGVIACRAAVTHRVPQGTCLMYHAKDRHLNVPLTELQGKRGGTDNSATRIVMKPTHFIGGYAQLSFGFNYYGPTGSQRDEIVVIRKREAEVVFQ
ncbi:MAG TPA: molybdopterin dinucleotide binding domain-containing protein, partial [Thermoleophilaceae bacterium]|nr:molybdopterin dinucleotide binding domain-containing protein [Thermoleophilaceae bacterium]